MSLIDKVLEDDRSVHKKQHSDGCFVKAYPAETAQMFAELQSHYLFEDRFGRPVHFYTAIWHILFPSLTAGHGNSIRARDYADGYAEESDATA